MKSRANYNTTLQGNKVFLSLKRLHMFTKINEFFRHFVFLTVFSIQNNKYSGGTE